MLALVFSGCFEPEATTTSKSFDNVSLDSKVVGLIFAELNKNEENGRILSVELEYRFKNLRNRYINVEVTVEFYDNDMELLGASETYKIGLRQGWEEQLSNFVTYSEYNAYKVDSVKIIAKEI